MEQAGGRRLEDGNVPRAALRARQEAAKGAAAAARSDRNKVDAHNHDTIAMVAIDASGAIAAGASSNGVNHKVRAPKAQP